MGGSLIGSIIPCMEKTSGKCRRSHEIGRVVKFLLRKSVIFHACGAGVCRKSAVETRGGYHVIWRFLPNLSKPLGKPLLFALPWSRSECPKENCFRLTHVHLHAHFGLAMADQMEVVAISPVDKSFFDENQNRTTDGRCRPLHRASRCAAMAG